MTTTPISAPSNPALPSGWGKRKAPISEGAIFWADLYDTVRPKAKNMIVNCLSRWVAVYQGYKLYIDFNIDFAQFSPGIDIAEITA